MDKQTRASLLIVDDDPDIREVLRLLLESEGYSVCEASCGEEALAKLDESIRLVILDVRMPGMNGFEVCTQMRARSDVMILFLTAKAQEADRVLGLRRGGDDYLAKPFSPAELSARVAALLRRYGREPEDKPDRRFHRGAVSVDPDACEVMRDGERIALTDLEYRLLIHLIQNVGETISARDLYETVWREPYLPISAGTVMVHVGNIRRKLESDAKQPTLIKTVWGKGYRVE
jgi:DNA-binding response OmpR family regulator